jgi:tetratricopeptide (TPR) repeat protein
MTDTITCPHCQRRLRLPDEAAGSEVRCPACNEPFQAPTLTPPPESIRDRPEPAPRPPADLSLPEPAPTFRRKKSRGPVVAIVAAVLLFLLLGGGLAWLVHQAKRPRRRPPVAFREDPDQKRADLQAALVNRKPLTEKEIAKELEPLFEDLGKAFRAADGERLVGHFDLERLFDELDTQGDLPEPIRRQRAHAIRGLHQGMASALARNSPLLAYDSFEIRHVRKLPNDEAVVIVRHRSDTVRLKMRWWVTRRSGPWKVYDYEDLDTAMRFTSIVGRLGGMALNQGPQLRRATAALQKVIFALRQEDPDTAERQLQVVRKVKWPPRMQAMVWMFSGNIHLQRGEFQEALKDYDKAEASNPDMPALSLLRGVACNGLGQWAQALEHLDAYRKLLGDDETLCYHRGQALRGVGRFPEAAAEYRKALDLQPNAGDAFLGLLLSLRPEDPRDDIPGRFQKMDQPHDAFVVFAEECVPYSDARAIEQMAQAMQQIDPKFAAVDYYLSLARAWQGKGTESARLFRAALDREEDPGRCRVYTEGFLEAMASAGAESEAYRAAPEPVEAFRLLAARLKSLGRSESLRGLITAHAGKHPDDPLLPFYRGEVFVRDGDYGRAEKAFRAGLAHPPDQPTLDSFRGSRVLARYHTGQGLSAYRDIGPARETFAQLATLMRFDEKTEELKKLVEAHARVEPDSPALLRYQLLLLVKDGQFEKALTRFRSALDKVKDEQARKGLVEDFLLDMAGEGKATEAYAVAPDPRAAFLILADELSNRELEKLLAAHRARAADDPWLAYYQAQVHLNQKAWDKAAEVLGTVWKDLPDDLHSQFRYKYCYALYKAGRVFEAYEKIGPRKETFSQLGWLLLGDKRAADLEKLAEAHRPHAADDPDWYYFRAQAHFLQGESAKGLPLLREAWQRQKVDYRRQGYVGGYVRYMHGEGKGMEGYRTAPDRAVAFETLAGLLVQEKKKEELARLIEEHSRDTPTSPLHGFYAGELALLQGDPAGAEAHFAAGAEKGRNRWRWQNGLYRGRVQAGKVVQTYEEFRKEPRIFATLASVCSAEKKPRQLEALIAAHRKARPEDGAILFWELERRWLDDDHAGVVRLIEEDREGVLSRPSFRWRRTDRLVRSLIKLKRHADARREARVSRKKGGSDLLVVLAHAAAGDVPASLKAAKEATRNSDWVVASFYHDPDLGPILRSEAFADFRKKYPPPKDNEERD